MQKELVTSTSLFCDATPPIAGATAGVHERDSQNEFRVDAIDDRVRVAVEKTSPDIAKLRAAERKARNLFENPISLAGESSWRINQTFEPK